MTDPQSDPQPNPLPRHFGLLHATALNITMIVGAGVFLTVPLMLLHLPGPYALLGWLLAGTVMIFDGMIWGELGATFPGSGGSYLYLLECYGRQRCGRLMAFLFIWQFLISGPLEIGSGLIAIAQFSSAIHRDFAEFDQARTLTWQPIEDISLAFGPSRLVAFAAGLLIIFLLYRRINVLGRMTLTLWVGVLGLIAWILLEGLFHGRLATAFNLAGASRGPDEGWTRGIGEAMRLAMYSYLGYYSVCYMGDEVRNPGKTIPRSILISSLAVAILFVLVHLAMVSTMPWDEILGDTENINNLPAELMRFIHGDWAATLVTVCLVWTCFGSAFAGMLAYSRIPFGAARYGHFFSVLARVHPRLQIPHVSLLLVGGLTLVWSFFSLDTVINALITTRIIEQFIGQIVGVIILRKYQPGRFRPFKMWLYPLPCAVALVGWTFMYVTSGLVFMLIGITTLLAGAAAFVAWSARTGTWPFGKTADSAQPIH